LEIPPQRKDPISAVAEPAINLSSSFTGLAIACWLTKQAIYLVC
jgi:hypothetical protein